MITQVNLSVLVGSNSNHSPTYHALICGALKRSVWSRRLLSSWWAQVDSNHRPHAYQACALTTWAMSPLVISVYLVLSPLLFPPSRSLTFGWFVNGLYYRHAMLGCRTPAGGDDGIRTHDPLLAGQVLSQLSYTPILLGFLLLSSLSVTQNWTTSESHSHLYLTWPLVCRDFALLKTTKSRKLRLQISCSP